MAFFLLSGCLVLFVVYLFYPRYSRGLHKFNGPFLASISNIWRLWYAHTVVQRPMYVDVHRKYGDIARIGPNELSFSDPRAIQEIYGPKGASQKSDSYKVPGAMVNGNPMEVLFSGTDIDWHTRQKRLLQPVFAMSHIVKYESGMDDTINVFIDQLHARFVTVAPPGRSFDAMTWFTFFSLDVVTQMAFGARYGFLEQGIDVDSYVGTMHMIETLWLYFTRMSFLDKLTLKNPILLWFNRHGWFVPKPPFAERMYRLFVERQNLQHEIKGRPQDQSTLTDTFLKIQADHPEVTDFQPFIHCSSVIGAASDSTGITLCSIFYLLITHRECYERLQKEIDRIECDTKGPMPFSATKDLTYLDAVINESMRCFWITRFPMTRVTPPAGMTICGEYVPGGVDVGVWGDVIHRRKEVFGDDVDEFRPERWLGDQEEVKKMKQALMPFGVGKYSCLGKNLARMLLVKLVPTLLREFEFEMADPQYRWISSPGIFALPVGFELRLRSRVG